MKNGKAKAILGPTLALFLICLVATVLLALTNNVTAAKIEQNAVQTAIASRAEVLSKVGDTAVATYSDDKTDEKSGLTYNEGYDDAGNVVGYIFTNAAKGYGGDVKVMVGYDLAGTIVGFTILDCSNETPGLGQNSKTPEFMGRFLGKSGTLEVNKNSNDGQNIQAITAATITSKAVVKAVNEATAAVNAMIGGADNG